MSNLDPYEGINFVKRRAEIVDKDGKIIFNEDVIFPDYFSDQDINIVASKYLCNEGKKKETSLKQMIDRVSDTITEWGEISNYFNDEEEKNLFNYKLKKYQILQYCAFNSPVYFNVGLKENPQGSACFILELNDNMDSITEIGKLEARIFKQGSGSGINYGHLRSTFEHVSGGGFASGPISFLLAHDTQAMVIKSGGTLRRSAKLACLNDTHPNIKDFISLKEREEEKLRILREAGFKPKKGHDLQDEVYFQNTNISVQLSDKFMQAVENDDEWWTHYVTTGKRHEKFKARDLLKLISEQAWKTADPGVQFHDNFNKMHTCPEDGEIESTNPCLPKWAPVLTKDGYKRLDKVEQNIFIDNKKYNCSELIKTSENEDVYQIELESGLKFYVTKEHKITLFNGEDRELKDIKVDDVIKVDYNSVIKNDFNLNLNDYRRGLIDGYIYVSSHFKNEIKIFEKSISYQLGILDFCLSNYFAYTDKSTSLFHISGKIFNINQLEELQLILASIGIYSELTHFHQDRSILKIPNIEQVRFDDLNYSNLIQNEKKVESIKKKQKIIDIAKFSREDVYDINVPVEHHFVTCGAVVHNCGEYAFINNSSCNLAAINYLKFITKDMNDDFHLNFNLLVDVVSTLFTAQEILIDHVSYPNEEITNNSRNFRPIGIGYSNMGATLMYVGFPYDSDEGRLIASNLTALLTGIGFVTSNKIANLKEPFKNFEKNKEHYYRVLGHHLDSVEEIVDEDINFDNSFISEIQERTSEVWGEISEMRENDEPFRNAQISLLMPCGTTSFLLGCATTGVEPEFSLIRYKRLSGTDGATIKLVNPVLKDALQNLICSNKEVNEAIEQILKDNYIDNVDVLSDDEKEIFATSVSEGKYEIPYMGHIKMIAAVQPFISGAISKTINLPSNITKEEIYDIYLKSWKMGIKGITVYRNGCKEFQPLSTSLKSDNKQEVNVITSNIRRKLPNDRMGKIHKFKIGGQTKGYIVCGEFNNGELGEIFVNISKQGSTLSGLMDTIATLSSISLQYGVPLKDIVRKMMFQKFEPAGFTNNEKIRTTSSLVDYIFRYLGLNYLNDEEKIEIGLISKTDNNNSKEEKTLKIKKENISTEPCPECGMLLRRLGSCTFCVNCNWNSGSCG